MFYVLELNLLGWYRTCFGDITPPPRDGSAQATVSLVKSALEMQGPMKPVGN